MPAVVEKAVETLAAEPDTTEIWLIGSRANGTANEQSDWDLLAFVQREPSPVPVRFEGVDVVLVGSSGMFLLEGMNQSFILPFTDFSWRRITPTLAVYRGKRFIAFEPGHVRDSNELPYIITECRALLLWSRDVPVESDA